MFSNAGKTADDVIERAAVRFQPYGEVMAVTDDNAERDTVISMGPKSRLAIETFVYHPQEKKLSLIARVLRGTVSFLSGQIAKLGPDLMHIETPQASVGVRGTHVLIQVD